jgi:hypothetical protein|tara:strand:- start:298 stop:501 length:204 start_codon:yes stop_codon:yes gene_type:complete
MDLPKADEVKKVDAPKAEQEEEQAMQPGTAQAEPGDVAVARLKRALCWRDATTEAAFVRRTGLSLLL